MIEGPRAARKDELEAVIALSNSVFRSRRDGDMGREFPTLFCEENCENLRIFLDDGKPVSLIGFTVRDIFIMGASIRVCNVGSVCTDPNYRGQGLATRLLEDTILKSLRDGVEVMLISGGRGLYRRAGCINAGIYHVYPIPKDARLPDLPVEVKRWEREDTPDLVRIHQSEPIRYVRDIDEFLTLLEARVVVNHPSDTWLVGVDGEMVAYICAQKPREEKDGVRVLNVEEMAGSRTAVLAALTKLFDLYNVDRINLNTTAADGEMRSLGKLIGVPYVPRGFHGTLRIIDLKGFFAAIEPYVSERLEEDELWGLEIEFEPDLIFRYEDEEFRLETIQDITAFVFGSLERERPTPKGPKLSRILDKLFPMPLVDYGLNFI
ncbi:GNAT family N-acetyltransferase [Candidatus Poribacteria bacterium]|nr:GNAT family N-acetyltransferase [Candidatus Poribacteria bacterium]